MELVRWMGRMFARFVAVSVAMVNAWMFLINVFSSQDWDPWVHVWIVASGVAGALGGILYLLSVDGANRFRTRPYRVGGWAAMLAAVLLPTQLTLILVPLVLLLIPTLFVVGPPPKSSEEAITSG